MLISHDVVGQVRALKEQPGKDISVLGSGELVQTLLENDLVDRFELFVNPLVLGRGKRLFREGLAPKRVRLGRCVATSAGVLLLTYELGDASASAAGSR